VRYCIQKRDAFQKRCASLRPFVCRSGTHHVSTGLSFLRVNLKLSQFRFYLRVLVTGPTAVAMIANDRNTEVDGPCLYFDVIGEDTSGFP
jgi:hypothetical protein